MPPAWRVRTVHGRLHRLKQQRKYNTNHKYLSIWNIWGSDMIWNSDCLHLSHAFYITTFQTVADGLLIWSILRGCLRLLRLLKSQWAHDTATHIMLLTLRRHAEWARKTTKVFKPLVEEGTPSRDRKMKSKSQSQILVQLACHWHVSECWLQPTP